MNAKKASHAKKAFLFDLDGTLIDTVYEHALAWQEALNQFGISLPAATIHRRIGMSGTTLLHAFQREAHVKLSAPKVKRLEEFHAEAYKKRSRQIRPLPGARDLLSKLSKLKVPWAIATSGNQSDAVHTLDTLKLHAKFILVSKEDVKNTKPEPDLFLAAAAKLGAEMEQCIVVGDSIWDLLAAQRAHALGVGLLSGGIGEDELEHAGAYRVYRDTADLLAHLDDLGTL